ncbi:unnamed protein product [Parajaminaea phylloscopi]
MSFFSEAVQKVFHGHGGGSQAGPAPQQGTAYGSAAPPGDFPRVSVGYFPSWDIYDRGYKPDHIPVRSLTHLLYCFADIKPESGEVFLTDAWADEQIHYDGDSWEEPGSNLYGNLKALYRLKQQNRHLKVLLSIGGWSFSSHFAPVACDSGKRARFVATAVRLVADYGLDGLDIDWEYPENPGQANDYVSLLGELRASLNGLAREIGAQEGALQLTIAAPCGIEQASKLNVAEMDRHLTFWNLMAYDMAGSWDSAAGHQAPLFKSHPGAPCVDEAIELYRSRGVASHKLVLGMPCYGRAFENTNGPGHPFQGVGRGSWEDGSWDYKALPLSGAQEYYDGQIVAASCYDPQRRVFVTYESPDSARAKSHYIRQKGLLGAMWWELSGDRTDHRSLVGLVAHEIGSGGPGLDGSPNQLRYPTSKWDNLRENRIRVGPLQDPVFSL